MLTSPDIEQRFHIRHQVIMLNTKSSVFKNSLQKQNIANVRACKYVAAKVKIVKQTHLGNVNDVQTIVSVTAEN